MKLLTLAMAAAISVASARPAVVELFTSQGCSSCPPADAFVGELVQRSDVLPLTFHVDYWDELGWQDRFELPIAAQRQATYVRKLNLPSPYTPQFIVDGKIDLSGRHRTLLAQAIRAPIEAAVASLSIKGAQLLIEVGAGVSALPGDVVLVTYLSQAKTAIGRGENSGKSLHEFNIVRSFEILGQWQGSAAQWHVNLQSLPKEADHAAVLIQIPGPGAILGAASVGLPRP